MQVHPETNAVDALTDRIAALEVRVEALEHPSTTVATPREEISPPSELMLPAAGVVSDVGIGSTFIGSLSLVGAALLGIAGAYVLRAISGASLLPRGVVAGLAAVYAAAWLVAAARAASRRLAASLFAVTSILILAPMIWEMTIRFQAMSATAAAGYLTAYAALATVIGFRSARQTAFKGSGSTAFTVAVSGSAFIAVALCIATHSMALFAAILLAMCAVTELSPLRHRARVVRVLISFCADFSVWALIYLYSLPPGEQTGYPPLSSAAIFSAVFLLFAIQLVSLVLFVVQRSRPLEVFSAFQVIVSFALLVFGIARFVPAHSTRVIGFLCLALALGGYAAGYGPIRSAAQPRKLGVFLAWSCMLLFAATFLLTSQAVGSVILGLLALASVPLASKMRAQSIPVQGAIFLCAAAFTSGLLAYAATALTGTMPGLPSWYVVLVAGSALLVYALAGDPPGEAALSQILHLLQALIAACGVAAFLARGLVSASALVLMPGAGHIAVLRTFALCAAAVALTWLGARFRRAQMARVAYFALALAAAKLLFVDLRLGRMEFIAVSIFLVALTFISVSRLARAPVSA